MHVPYITVVVAGKRGAWAKEFAPKEETAEVGPGASSTLAVTPC